MKNKIKMLNPEKKKKNFTPVQPIFNDVGKNIIFFSLQIPQKIICFQKTKRKKFLKKNRRDILK